MNGRLQLRFDGISQPVQIDGSDALLPAIRSVFRYWPFELIEEDNGETPVIAVRRDGDGYFVHAAWRKKPPRYSNPVNVACGLGVNVNRAMLLEQDSHLCLHGAAIEIGGRLVVLPNYYKAGKSTLTACLAAAGARIFSDDILPLLPDGAGMALGISPRLRLPLPDTMGERSLRFADSRRGASNKQYLYLDLEPHEQARFGQTAPIGGIVLLDRRESGPASLAPVGDGEVLKQLVLRNFVRQVTAETSLEKLHGLVAPSACYRLSYSNGDDAAALLVDRFTNDLPAAAEPVAAAKTDHAAGQPQQSIGGTHPRRRDGMSERLVDNDLFLVDETGETIYHLNPIGAGLWRLLDGSCGVQEAAELLHMAFPDVERKKIENDVATLAYDLLRRGLLVHGRHCGPGGRY